MAVYFFAYNGGHMRDGWDLFQVKLWRLVAHLILALQAGEKLRIAAF